MRKGVRAATQTNFMGRISVDPAVFGGTPIIRGRRLAVEHVLAMLAAGDSVEVLLESYPWLEREDVLACVEFATGVVGHERFEPTIVDRAL